MTDYSDRVREARQKYETAANATPPSGVWTSWGLSDWDTWLRQAHIAADAAFDALARAIVEDDRRVKAAGAYVTAIAGVVAFKEDDREQRDRLQRVANDAWDALVAAFDAPEGDGHD